MVIGMGVSGQVDDDYSGGCRGGSHSGVGVRVA